MRQTEVIRSLIHCIVLIGLTVSSGVGIVLAFAPKVKQLQQDHHTYDSLQQRIEEAVAIEQKLKEKQRRFLSDPEFVRKIAYEAGYARTNEIIFQFPEESESRDAAF